uniref:Splicing factor 3a subunit 2 n=1 Tax=Loxodonta africana TaxID=9785 RepID=G3TQ45_LOXAF
MDFQHRPGGKTGSGGVASSESNRDRRRLRRLALETIDINKDPYFMKNHLGSYECKLCLTLHNNDGSYLAHQGKKHQTNLARRAAKEAKEAPAQPAPEKVKVEVKKFVKIGRPGYKVTKQRDTEVGQQSLLFQIDYPEIAEGVMPRHRFMSAYEQRIEPPDRRWQYLLMAAEPYETIAFKVPSREIDKAEGKFWTHWNRETKQFFLQFHFKMRSPCTPSLPPGSGKAAPTPLMNGLPPPWPPCPCRVGCPSWGGRPLPIPEHPLPGAGRGPPSQGPLSEQGGHPRSPHEHPPPLPPARSSPPKSFRTQAPCERKRATPWPGSLSLPLGGPRRPLTGLGVPRVPRPRPMALFTCLPAPGPPPASPGVRAPPPSTHPWSSNGGHGWGMGGHSPPASSCHHKHVSTPGQRGGPSLGPQDQGGDGVGEGCYGEGSPGVRALPRPRIPPPPPSPPPAPLTPQPPCQ